jgi:hypothetical protein
MSAPRLVCRPCQIYEFTIVVHLQGCSSQQCVLCCQALGCGESMVICCNISGMLDDYTTGFGIHMICNILVRGPLWRKIKLSYLEATSVRRWHCATHQIFCRCLRTALSKVVREPWGSCSSVQWQSCFTYRRQLIYVRTCIHFCRSWWNLGGGFEFLQNRNSEKGGYLSVSALFFAHSLSDMHHRMLWSNGQFHDGVRRNGIIFLSA